MLGESALTTISSSVLRAVTRRIGHACLLQRLEKTIHALLDCKGSAAHSCSLSDSHTPAIAAIDGFRHRALARPELHPASGRTVASSSVFAGPSSVASRRFRGHECTASRSRLDEEHSTPRRCGEGRSIMREQLEATLIRPEGNDGAQPQGAYYSLTPKARRTRRRAIAGALLGGR